MFVIQFGLLLKWTDVGDDSSTLTVFVRNPSMPESAIYAYLNAIAILTVLSVYVGYFSHKKFKRIKKQTEQYRKIKVLSLADY